MSSLRNGRSSRRTITGSAAISAVTTVVALQGCQTLAGSRSFHDACHEVAKGATTPWRVSFEGQRCVVMIDPVLADSELAERELPRAMSGTLAHAFPGSTPSPRTSTTSPAPDSRCTPPTRPAGC